MMLVAMALALLTVMVMVVLTSPRVATIEAMALAISHGLIAQRAYNTLGIRRGQLQVISAHVKRRRLLVIEIDQDLQFASVKATRSTSLESTLIVIVCADG